MENNQLYHHGILGMKWGVRRFQNKDGSLTKAGKKRYGDDADETKAKKKAEKKSVKDMSDDELNKALQRAQTEVQYKRSQDELSSTGKKFFKAVRDKVLAPAATAAAENFVRKALTKWGDDILQKNPSEIDRLKKEYEKLDLQDKIKRIKNEEDSKLWESRTKKLEYENKKKDQRNSDLKRDFDYDQTKKAYDDWKAKDETTRSGETFVAGLLEAPKEVDR